MGADRENQLRGKTFWHIVIELPWIELLGGSQGKNNSLTKRWLVFFKNGVQSTLVRFVKNLAENCACVRDNLCKSKYLVLFCTINFRNYIVRRTAKLLRTKLVPIYGLQALDKFQWLRLNGAIMSPSRYSGVCPPSLLVQSCKPC